VNPGPLTPKAEIIDFFEPWINDPQTATLRFENPVSSKGGGDHTLQKASLRKRADHFGIEMSEEKFTDIMDKTFQTKSLTFHGCPIGK